mmetsp:Transcript_17905/g.47209  ORF Transcript_17905/g.47209 Transcript_17905/m.47209 type:complete len:88 (-) Transcript_17905:10-273(-)
MPHLGTTVHFKDFSGQGAVPQPKPVPGAHVKPAFSRSGCADHPQAERTGVGCNINRTFSATAPAAAAAVVVSRQNGAMAGPTKAGEV